MGSMKLIVAGLAISGMFLTSACSKNQQSTLAPTAKNAGIVGGTAVADSETIAKSTALLLSIKTGTKAGHTVITSLALCTGTVLADNLVLTAGHCSSSDPKNLFLVFSTQIPSDWKSFFQGIKTNPLVRRVSGGVTAPNWAKLSNGQDKNWGDLTLLRFDGGLPTGFVAANVLSPNSSLANNQAITLAGFGETDGVNHTEATQLMKTTVKIDNANYSDTEILIANVDGKGACHGDSGGPAYVQDANGNLFLAGVTSRADIATDPQAVCVGKSIYTKVQSYETWIVTEGRNLTTSPNYGTVIAEPAGF